ncbi:hypothetical protein D3C72_1397620 [compost metagenome]
MPSVMHCTRPLSRSGRPFRSSAGMSVLPPTSSVTDCPTPAAISSATAPGSQNGPATTPSSPWRRTSPSTVISSVGPPAPQLSPWSTSTTGPCVSVLARAMDSSIGSIGKTKSARRSHAMPQSSSSRRRPASTLAASATITTARPVCGISASGKPPNTEALSTSPSRSAAIARSMMSFMGCARGVWRSMWVSIGSVRHNRTGRASPRSAAIRVRAARAPVSYTSTWG